MANKSFLLFCFLFVLLSVFSFADTLTDCNQILSASGTYYLQNDLNMADTNGLEGMNTYCLEVTGDDITIDCNGFRIKNETTVINTMGILGKAAAPGDSVDNLNVVGCRGSKLHYLVYLLEVDTKDLNIYRTSFEAIGPQVMATISECGSYFEEVVGRIGTRKDLNTYWDLTDNNACIEINNSPGITVDFDAMWSNAIFGTDNNSSHIGILLDDNSGWTTLLDINVFGVYTGLESQSSLFIINSNFYDINDLSFSDYNLAVINTKVDDQNLIWFNKYFPSTACPSDFNTSHDNAVAYVFYDCDYTTALDVNGLELTDNVVSGVGSLPPFYLYDVNITIHDFNIQLSPSGSEIVQSVIYYKQHDYAPAMGVGCAGGLGISAIYGYPFKVEDTYVNNPNPNFAYLATIYTTGYGGRFYDVNVDGNVYASTAIEGLGLISSKDLNFNGDMVWSYSNYDSDNNCPGDINSDYNSGAVYAFNYCSGDQTFDGISFDSSYTLFPSPNSYQIYSYGSDLNLANIDFNSPEGSVKIGYGTLKLQDSNIQSSAAKNVYLCDSNFTSYDSNVYASLGYPLVFDLNVVFDINNSSFFGDYSFKNDPTFIGVPDCISGDIKNSSFDVGGTGEYSLYLKNDSSCADSLDINNNILFDSTVLFNYVGNFVDNNYNDNSVSVADFNESIDANFYNNSFEIIEFLNANGSTTFYDNLVASNLNGASPIYFEDSNLTISIYDNNIYNNYDCSTCYNLEFSGDNNGTYSVYNNKFSVQNDANYFKLSTDSTDITLDLNTTLSCTGSKNIVQGTCMGGNLWSSDALTGQSDICEDRLSYYGVCDTNFAPSGLSGFYDYHPLVEMMFVDPGVSPTDVEYTDGTDTIDFNLSTSFYDLYYSAGVANYIKDGTDLDVNLKIYYSLVSNWEIFDYKLRKLITVTNNDSVQKNSFTLDLNLDDYSGLAINPYQITFSSGVDHYAVLNSDTNNLMIEVGLSDFLASSVDRNIYVYYDYKWYDKEVDVNKTYPIFYSWKSSNLYDFNGSFYAVEPANSTYSFGVGTSNVGNDSDLQIYIYKFNEVNNGMASSTGFVDVDGNAVAYGGVYNSNDGNYLVLGKLDSNAAVYLLDGDNLSTLITTLDFNFPGQVTEGIIGSDGNYYLLVDNNDTNAMIYKISPTLSTIYDSNFLAFIEKDIIESDGNLLVMGVNGSGNTVIFDMNTDLDASSLTITGVLMVEMEEDEDGNIIYVGKDDWNNVILNKYDRDMSTLISDKNYSNYVINNADYIDLEFFDGNLYYNGSERDYNYILRLSNRAPLNYSWILYLDSDLNIVARGYYPNLVFTKEGTIANNKYYAGTSLADVYTFELYREDVNTTNTYDEPTLLVNGSIENYCDTTYLNEQVGDDCNYSNDFSSFTNDVNYVMMIYGESKNASSVFRKNMNYFFFNVPTISSGGNPGNPGGDDPGDGGLPPDDVNDENIPQDENIIIPHIENPYIDTNEPDANIDINYLPEIFLGDGQGIKITKNGLCVVGAKVVVTAPDGTKKEYVLTDTCELEFIPDQEGDYIIEITLPDGTKIIKQFKVKPKGKAGIFDDTESLIACIVLGGLGVFLVGFVTYRYFFPKKLGGLKNV